MAVASFAVAGDARSDVRLHRFAVVAGNDRGGADTRPLEYATEDARRIHGVLTELGGVARDDATLLLNRSSSDLVAALAGIESRIAAARTRGERTTIVVYYSGHAKDGELRLGDTRLALGTLKARLQKLPAEVVVGIFDSCRSGVRFKGAVKGPAFEIQNSVAEDARGVVFLSSSSADEDAQESDDIRGSYFSHHLASGLRGSADRSGDGRVTLSEAYSYAYSRTVADTAESAAGAQHPTFDIGLKGNGELVLTEPVTRREGLRVPGPAPGGTYYVVQSGFIAAELVKPDNEERRLALAPGRYLVKRRLPDRLRVGEVRIAVGQLVTLDEAALKDVPFSDDPVKGASRDASMGLTAAAGFQSFFDEQTRNSLFPPAGLIGIELQIRDFFRRGWVVSADLTLGGTRATLVRPDDSALPYRFSEVGLGGSLFTEWHHGNLIPFMGGRVALMVMHREFETKTIPKQDFSTFSPSFIGGLRYRLGSGFSAQVRGRIGYFFYNVDHKERSLGYLELATAVSYDF